MISTPPADDRPTVVVMTIAELEGRLGASQPSDRPATMSVDAAARHLGISRSHAYDLVRAGELPHVRLGRRIVIPTRELDALLARATRGGTQPSSTLPSAAAVDASAAATAWA